MTIRIKDMTVKIELLLLILLLICLLFRQAFYFMYYFFACYLFIIFHEFSHMLMANLLRKKVCGMDFTISGVCATIKEYDVIRNRQKTANGIIYLAGPISNFLLAFLFYKVRIIWEINLFLGLLNLVPIFPLDGYHIFYNFLQLIMSKRKCEKVIITLKNVFIFLLFCIGIYQIISYKSISILVFFFYLCVLNKQHKKAL